MFRFSQLARVCFWLLATSLGQRVGLNTCSEASKLGGRGKVRLATSQWLATTIVLASYVPFANVCDKLLEVWQMHRARGLIWDKLNIRECFLISLFAWLPPESWITPKREA